MKNEDHFQKSLVMEFPNHATVNSQKKCKCENATYFST